MFDLSNFNNEKYKYPLTAEQEEHLFDHYRYARWWAERDCPEAIPVMQHIRNVIVTATLPLVEIIACKTGKRASDYEEKLSDGQLALLGAVESFDPNRGARFRTYVNRLLTWKFLSRELPSRISVTPLPDDYDVADPGSLEGVEIDETSDQLRNILKVRLTEREQLVVAKRYGIGRKASNSLRELAAELGIGVNQARKIMNTAMQSLKI